MDKFLWPQNFPTMEEMMDMLQKMSKAAWQNDTSFSVQEIDNWLNNFKGKVTDADIEKRIALWLLCNFTFYNEKEIDHLCLIVYKKFLHEVAVENSIKEGSDLSLLLRNIYFAALGDASKSGGLMLYHFRQQSGLDLSSFYYPSAIPKNEKGIVVFVDDVTLSGGSAIKFFRNNLTSMKYNKAYCLTLFASDEAKSTIESFGIKVLEATVLSDREKCFSKDSLVFADYPDLRELAEKIATTYGEMLYPGNPLGYKNGQYCFGMHYNTPNNTLPIFWSTKQWIPIFQRKEAYGHAGRNTKYDKYI